MEDINYFKDVVGLENVLTSLTGDDDLQPFNIDFTKKYKGNSQVVLMPTTTEQISQILKHCNQRKLAIVPQGGNTGLVGGSVPLHDEIVICTKKMDKILGFDDIKGVVKC
jgi:D-lactate dehydrogenase (cytochrome)